MEIKATEVEITKITLEPNETLLVNFKGDISQAQMQSFSKHLKEKLQTDRVVVMAGMDIEFSKITM